MMIPEHDPELSPNLRAARRMLEMIEPSPDDPQRPRPNEQIDDTPQLRSSHVFVVKDDAIIDLKPRNDPSLGKTLVGPLDQYGHRLAETSVHHRVGIFVRIDWQRALVAESTPAFIQERRFGTVAELNAALPVPPSLTVFNGRSPLPDASLYTWVWLFSDGAISIEDREAINRRLAECGVSLVMGSTALIRVAGFYNRSGGASMVSCQGSLDFGTRTVRYSAQALREGFLGEPQPAAVEEKTAMRIPIDMLRKHDIDTEEKPAIVGVVRMPIATEPYAQLGLFKSFPAAPSLVIADPAQHQVHLVWLIDAPLSDQQHAMAARRLKSFGVEVAARGIRVPLPADGLWRGNYDQGDAAGVHRVSDLVHAFAG